MPALDPFKSNFQSFLLYLQAVQEDPSEGRADVEQCTGSCVTCMYLWVCAPAQ